MSKRLLTIIGLLAFGAVMLLSAKAEAATITVCTTGCTQPATAAGLQAAINAAVSATSDVILLEQNKVFVGTFILRQKACAAGNDTCYVTIKTGVTSTGSVISSGSFPAADIRTSPSYTSIYAKIQPSATNSPAFRTVFPGETGAGTGCTSAPCVASYWRLQNLEVNSNSYGGSTLVDFGTQGTAAIGLPGSDLQDNASEEPHHLQIVQVFFNGDDIRGQERALLIAARNVTIKDCYIDDMKAISDKAAIWSDNSTGDITITNNDIYGGTEGIIFGGDTPKMRDDTTVAASPTPTTTTFTLATAPKDFLVVGNAISVVVSGVIRTTTVSAIAGSALTVAALPSAPAAGAAVNYSVVPRVGLVNKNYIHKNPAWRNPIVSTPQAVSAAAAITGGTLAAGTYAYKVTGIMNVNGGQVARSTASVELTATVASGTTGSVTVSWDPIANVDSYKLYGRNSGAQNVRYTVATTACTGSPSRCVFTDTNASGTTEAVPSTAGSTWMMKNLFEIKKYNTMTVEGNLMEYSWQSGQTGFAVLMTPANNSTGVNGNDSTVIKDITFQKNRIRHSAAAFQLHGRSADGDVSDRTSGVTVQHNIWEDIGTAWGISENMALFSTNGNVAYAPPEKRGPLNILINHNTFLNNQGKSVPLFDLFKTEAHECENCDWTNNIQRKVTSGLRALNAGGTMAEGSVSWDAATDASSSWSNNVVVGASCSLYPGTPASTWCPSEATFQGIFANYGAGDYHVTGSWLTAATDGTMVGADLTLIDPLTAIALSGDNSGGTIITPPTITTTTLSNASLGASYSAALSATGGTTPYTWALVSPTTLPTGLSLNTSTGAITGIPTVSGPVSFTIRATGANTGTTTSNFTISVNSVVSPGDERPSSVDYSEIAIFRRDVEPDCIADPLGKVRTGDLWLNLTTFIWNTATSTGPSCVWTPISAGSTAPVTITFMSSEANASWSMTSAAAQFSPSNDTFYDLTGKTECLFSMRTNAVADGVVWVRYSTTNTTTSTDLGTTSETPGVSLASPTASWVSGSWTPIVSGAKTFVRLGVWGRSPSNATNSAVRGMVLVCR